MARSQPLPESRSSMLRSGLDRVDSLHLLKSYPNVFSSELKFFRPAGDRRLGTAICMRMMPAEYISKRSGLLSCIGPVDWSQMPVRIRRQGNDILRVELLSFLPATVWGRGSLRSARPEALAFPPEEHTVPGGSSRDRAARDRARSSCRFEGRWPLRSRSA